MKQRLTGLLIVLVIGGLANGASAEILSADVTGGSLRGVSLDGVAEFIGVPFAAPPTGRNRWREPQPVASWAGTRAADDYGPACMQDPAMVAFLGSDVSVSEDCLYLDIWTPAETPDDLLPVMVWIYGGGFAAGATSSPTYVGEALAREGVIVVNVSYRVGVFGFLAHPELTREGMGSSGNYGLLDQIAALKWVQDNIGVFGGDASNVTIFGESAGGFSVSMLAASPAATGLFQRAISESGGSFAPVNTGNQAGPSGVPTLALGEIAGEEFIDKLGVATITEARSLPAETIREAQGQGLGGGFGPVVDGRVLVGDSYLLYEQGQFNDTPVLIGTNSDEGASFVQGTTTAAAFESMVRADYGPQAGQILAAYPHANDREATQSARDIRRDVTFAWPTWAWAQLQSTRGENNAYVYYFDHKTPSSPNGSAHAAELGYVFGTLEARGDSPRPEDLALSRLMMQYWTNFAKTGDPNGSGLPAWPAFDVSNQRAMVFDSPSGAKPLPNVQKLEAVDGYFAWRRANVGY